jgi:hypothetical protein
METEKMVRMKAACRPVDPAVLFRSQTKRLRWLSQTFGTFRPAKRVALWLQHNPDYGGVPARRSKSTTAFFGFP